MLFALIKTDVLIVIPEPASFSLRIFRPYGALVWRVDSDRALPCFIVLRPYGAKNTDHQFWDLVEGSSLQG